MSERPGGRSPHACVPAATDHARAHAHAAREPQFPAAGCLPSNNAVINSAAPKSLRHGAWAKTGNCRILGAHQCTYTCDTPRSPHPPPCLAGGAAGKAALLRADRVSSCPADWQWVCVPGQGLQKTDPPDSSGPRAPAFSMHAHMHACTHRQQSTSHFKQPAHIGQSTPAMHAGASS